MQLGNEGAQVFFEIRIHKRTDVAGIKELIHGQTQETYYFGVESIMTGEGLDIGVRDTLVSVSANYNTRKEALEAAEKFIEDYKAKLKQQHPDNT